MDTTPDDVPGWIRERLERVAGVGAPCEARRTRSGATLYRLGDAVAKLHRVGTDPAALAARLRLCVDFRTALLTPLDRSVVAGPDGRLATLWPWVEVLREDETDPPWASCGALLATLHAVPAGEGTPTHGWVARLRRAVTRASDEVSGLGRRLLAEASARQEPRVLLHGDWHLGQVARGRGHGWCLIDPDDVGVGHPAWDLARPAGFWAAGLLTDAEWTALLHAYRDACAPHVGDAWGPDAPGTWGALDLPARCAVFVAAASGSHPADATAALLGACRRMAQ